ncbi:EmrB/QacA subfamily drug resistance transporter [Bradymonas sediminis]|nr:EmrB/QacA subfamily drug resistance transporter [Bradymonas sediminis]
MEDASYTPDPHRWRLLGLLIVVLFMSLIDVGIVNVAVPSIQEGLGASDAEIQWVLAGYALTFGVGLVTSGRAGDIYGRGPLFIIGIIVFTASSVACGLAQSALLLNIGRAVQGVGSCLIAPQVVGMIQQHFRGTERGRAFGIFGAAAAASFVVGPLTGGYIIMVAGVETGWRWTFLINLPIGILATFLAWRWLPRPLWTPRDPDANAERSLDPVGALLLGFAVLCVMLPFVEGRGAALVWLSLPLGLGLFAVWVWWEKRRKRLGLQPMVDLAIFKVKSFSNGTLMISLFFASNTGIWVLVALYLQSGLGHTAFASGSVGIPGSILSSLAALWGGKVVNTRGRAVVLGGMYLAALGIALSILVVWLRSQGLASEWFLWGSLGVLGIGQGFVVSPNQTLTLDEVPVRYAGSSGGIMQTGQRIGATVGISILTATAFASYHATNDWSQAFIAGLVVALIITLAATAVAYIDQRQRLQKPTPMTH